MTGSTGTLPQGPASPFSRTRGVRIRGKERDRSSRDAPFRLQRLDPSQCKQKPRDASPPPPSTTQGWSVSLAARPGITRLKVLVEQQKAVVESQKRQSSHWYNYSHPNRERLLPPRISKLPRFGFPRRQSPRQDVKTCSSSACPRGRRPSRRRDGQEATSCREPRLPAGPDHPCANRASPTPSSPPPRGMPDAGIPPQQDSRSAGPPTLSHAVTTARRPSSIHELARYTPPTRFRCL